jgi:hypothetical protein
LELRLFDEEFKKKLELRLFDEEFKKNKNMQVTYSIIKYIVVKKKSYKMLTQRKEKK